MKAAAPKYRQVLKTTASDPISPSLFDNCNLSFLPIVANSYSLRFHLKLS